MESPAGEQSVRIMEEYEERVEKATQKCPKKGFESLTC